MGVLHMAIPFPSFPALPVREARPLSVQTASPPVAARPLSSRTEVRVQRTAEQQVEHDALAGLVVQCVAGSQQAWRQLVNSQHSRVYGICLRFLGSQTEAEDATQDVFLKLFRNLRSFDPAKASLQTWITTLTRNLLVDQFRRTRLERATDSLDSSQSYDDDEPGPAGGLAGRLADQRPNQEHHVAGLELKARIQHALLQLPPELREAVILRDLEDLDYREIAAVLKIPEGTVKSRISRGRGQLGKLLGQSEGQEVQA